MKYATPAPVSIYIQNKFNDQTGSGPDQSIHTITQDVRSLLKIIPVTARWVTMNAKTLHVGSFDIHISICGPTVSDGYSSTHRRISIEIGITKPTIHSLEPKQNKISYVLPEKKQLIGKYC